MIASAQYARLDAQGTTLVLRVVQARAPELLYLGERLPADCDLDALACALQCPVPHGGLDVAEAVSWTPEPGQGFVNHPGLDLLRGDRLLYTQLRCVQIDSAPYRVAISCIDEVAGIELQYSIEMDPDAAVVTAWTSVANTSEHALEVRWLSALSMPVDPAQQEIVSLRGRWSREFQWTREALPAGAWLQETRMGRTSHCAFPGVVLTQAGATQTSGAALAAHLAWSGNHRIIVEPLRHGGRQLQVGELLLSGEGLLASGARYTTPRLHLVHTNQGLMDASARLQTFVRERVLPPNASAVRKVQFNTWEAVYFDHEPARMLELVECAAQLGVERFILDDGWFANRRNDRAGLGDWRPCPERYPRGLRSLAEACIARGMEFGLWIEPECVNADSELYRRFPNWVLADPARTQPLGRHQYVLNFGLPQVRDHFRRVLTELLQSAPISALKWDMNRDMTHAIDERGRPAVRAHVEGVYQLMDELRSAFPQLEIESCASGGARADYAVLRRTDRIWASDCNDPLERQRIHRGFLQFFPAQVLGVHVGDVRSHTTGRVSELATRAACALFGSLGVEANLLALSADERVALARYIELYKRERGWLQHAHVFPLDHSADALSAFAALAADRRRALISMTMLDRTADALLAPLRIPGLLPNELYRVQLDPHWRRPRDLMKQESAFHQGATLQLHGASLGRGGFAPPALHPGSACVVRIEHVTEHATAS